MLDSTFHRYLRSTAALFAVFLTFVAGRMDGATFPSPNTGKIVGKITDAQTGEALPGANVIIDGTTIGAAADVDGQFLILQAPPGTHTLRVTMIGYATSLVEDVKVQSGLTTEINVALSPSTLEQEEVVVTAERPVIQKDETASAVYLDVRQLSELPVTSTREGLMIQSGVLFDPEPIMGGLGGSGRGEARYAIRGGEQSEVLWFMDGARVASLIQGRADQGGSFTNVNLHAVQELQVLTGGFDAQYGGAQSGVVNVVTKEGGPQYRASLEYIYGPPGQRHFGNYIYDRDTQKEFIDHTLPDGTLDPDWWTEERSSQVYDYTDQADHQIYGSLGGPLSRTPPSSSPHSTVEKPTPIPAPAMRTSWPTSWATSSSGRSPVRNCDSAVCTTRSATRPSRRTATTRARSSTTGAGVHSSTTDRSSPPPNGPTPSRIDSITTYW
ncbi:MAG: carboxypeptidase-like regulatory domain-containing protein [Candidatus Latescibacterota bacterium]|jgi:hypothetical protein